MSDQPDEKPIYVRMVPCDGHGRGAFTDAQGVCGACDLRCGYITNEQGYRQAKPHNRPLPVHAIEDASECSCGGWHGTPISLEAQLTGSEDLLLSFQGKVDDIEHNNQNAVELLLDLHEKIDRLIGLMER